MHILAKNFSRGLVAIIALVVSSHFECQAQEPAQAEETRTGTISGKVYNDTGQPLVGATVSVRSAGIIVAIPRTVQTNTEGHFEVVGLDTGIYYVSAYSPAYVSPPSEPDEVPRTYRVGDSVRLDLIRGGVITGTVTNANNEPLAGVRVRALMVKDGNGKEVKGRFAGGERQTDDRGMYRIFGLPSGTYVVSGGGSGGNQYSLVNATDLDAPTYAPSSTRDTASEIQVRSGEEVTVDIRYRYEQGHTISGIAKGLGTNGLSVTLTQAAGTLTPVGNAYQPAGAKSFSFIGIPDGEYTISASEAVSRDNNVIPDMAVSDPVRITVKGSDVTGLELVPRPLASIAGRVVLEPSKVTECESKRHPLFNEMMLSLIQNRKDAENDQLTVFRAIAGGSIPDKEGGFVMKNLKAGNYTLSPRFYARYWYLKSMSLQGSTQPTSAKGPASLTKDVAKNWTTVKAGERLNGITITLSEGAASIKGLLAKEQTASGLRFYLVPSEREKLDDPLRYFTAEVIDGAFSLTNLPPGKYWTLVQPAPPDTPTSTEKLRLPDALEARTKLRRAAELLKSEVELKPCQNVTDLTVRLN